MIVLSDKNQKSTDFSYTFSNSILNIEVFDNVKEPLVFYHNDVTKINIISHEKSNCEFVEIFDKDSKENEVITNLDIKGTFNHVILNKSKIEKLDDINTANVSDEGFYQLIQLDFNNGETKIINTVNLNSKGNNGNIYFASVVNNSFIKRIENIINNNAEQTDGFMNNYGVSFDNGKLVIRGVGNIVKGASKSKSNQRSTMYVMDESSSATSEPILYIDEDDVEASHASAVGQIDENTIFYLCSRGLKKEVARKLIVLGEFKTLINLIRSLEIKNLIQDYLSEVIHNV